MCKSGRRDLFIQPEVRPDRPLGGSIKASNQLARAQRLKRGGDGSESGFDANYGRPDRNRNSNSRAMISLPAGRSEWASHERAMKRQTAVRMNSKLLLMSKFITSFSSATSCLKLSQLPQLILLILLSLSSVTIPMTSAIAQSNGGTNLLLPPSSSSSQTPNLSPPFNQRSSHYEKRQSNHHHHQEPEILILTATTTTTSGNGERRKFSNFSEQQEEELFSLKKRQQLLRERKLYLDQASDIVLLAADDSQSSSARRQKRSLSSEQANQCDRLQKLWNSLTHSYPALAANLVAWAHNDIRLSPPLAQLLSEADHASREMEDSKPPKGWLSRVLANPVYSKLVRHIQSQRQPKQPINSLANLQSDTPDSELAYGRVAHYPHELTQSSDTLNKLHQLGQHRRTFGHENEELESNRIPAPESNSDSIVPDPDSDATRSSFVYGSVLLRPNQRLDNESQNERHMQNSLESLRQLSDTTRDRSAGGEDQSQRLGQDSAESYGRVLTSPPNLSDIPQLSKGNDNQQHITKQHHLTKGQPDSLRSRWRANKSTLDKLRHQLHPNQLDLGGLGSGTGIESSANVDELSTQQQAQLTNVAIQQPHQQQTDDPNVNEFEGIWHSGPLQQIEVRHQRANEGQVNEEQQQQQQMKHRVTTSNPNNVFLID